MEWLNFHHLRYFWQVAKEGSVSAAAKRLHVTQPTVSEQVHALESALGERLLRREGRDVVLTDAGQTVLRYADEIFSLGGALVDVVKGREAGRTLRLSVGISDAIPKTIALRILEPVFSMNERVSVICQEGAPHRLFADLAAHALDVVLTDAPSYEPRTFNHLLGECGVGIFGVRRLAQELKVGFPKSLDGAPFLLPTPATALRRELDAWFLARRVVPRVVGEFQDAALLTTFAEDGRGLFAAPDLIAREAGRQRGLVRVGSVKPLRVSYYAVTVERRLVHPAVSLVAGEARARLFGAAGARLKPPKT